MIIRIYMYMYLRIIINTIIYFLQLTAACSIGRQAE